MLGELGIYPENPQFQIPAGKCIMRPNVVSDPDNSRKTLDAHVALSDAGEDSEGQIV